MEYVVSAQEWRSIFAVPAQVVDKHIRTCGALSLRALLILLRRGGTADEEQIAQELAMDIGEIRDALWYWVNAGILSTDTSQQSKNHTEPEEKKIQPTPEPPKAKEKSRPVQEIPPKGTSSYRGRPSSEQIAAMMEKDPNIEFLFQAASEKLGKYLHITDRSSLIYLYDWAGIPIDVILMVIQYCCSVGKRQMRYIERVALDWQDAGVTSLETAEEHIHQIEEHNSWAGEVKAAFGIRDRDLIDKEQEYVNKWYGEYHSGMSMIRLAYERTIERIGKLSFPYIDSILKSWKEKNIMTPQEALQEQAQRDEQPTQSKQRPRYQSSKGEDELGTPSYDLDEVNRLILDAAINPQKLRESQAVLGRTEKG